MLYSFTGARWGAAAASLICDSSGKLDGTTFSGGTGNMGVVFMLNTAGQETVLYTFTGGADGARPSGPLIRDSAGNFYGTAASGGIGNAGVVYMLDVTGHETVLYSFTGGADGLAPDLGVVRHSAGNLYGTTYAGGTGKAGVVFMLNAAGQETVLHSFAGDDGKNPQGVIRDSVGNLFGTTSGGGRRKSGVVYKLDTSGKLRVLYQFTGGADGDYPDSGVVRDSLGNFYGTTAGGGTGKVGVVYMVDTGGNETVLHSFNWTDGAAPYSSVIRDPAGNLYGTTDTGGTGYSGVVYKLDASGHETVLHAFADWKDGWGPLAGLIGDPEGNLYGTTYQGGPGEGTVFKLDLRWAGDITLQLHGRDGWGAALGGRGPRSRGQSLWDYAIRRRRRRRSGFQSGRDWS